MSKYKTKALLDVLIERDGYAYAAGYLISVLEYLPYSVNLNAKQEKAFREYIEKHINSTKKLIEEG